MKSPEIADPGPPGPGVRCAICTVPASMWSVERQHTQPVLCPSCLELHRELCSFARRCYVAMRAGAWEEVDSLILQNMRNLERFQCLRATRICFPTFRKIEGLEFIWKPGIYA